ncbi:sensor histidine kinase [Spirosoma areae]
MIRNLVILFVVVVAIVLGMAAYHLRSVNALTEQITPFFHWEDTGGRTTAEEAARVGSFRPVRKRRINVGYTESIHWFRFSVEADSLPKELTLEIRNHTIDRLDLFERKNGVITSLGKTGSRLPFARRPSPTKTFAYLLNVETGQPTEYYLRLDKRHENLVTELTLWRTNDFEDKEQREYFLWGIFSGVIGLIVLLAFLFFATTRDPVYGCYGLYVLALALRQFADAGLGFQYLWPRMPAINHPDAVILALWLYVPSLFLFQQYFLALRTESIRLFRLTQVVKYTFFGLFMGLVISQITGLTETYTGTYKLVTQIHTWMAVGAFLLFPVIIAVGLKSHDTVKQLYAAGFGIQFACQLFIIAQNMMRYRADGIFFMDAYLILMVIFFIDIVIFAYLLAYRYRKSTDDQRRLQINLAQTRQHTNEAIIDVLESERQQVGDLILTDVGGRLSKTRALLTNLPESPLLTEALELIAKTDANVNQILRDSLPPDLMQKGLPAALAERVQQCCQTNSLRLSFAHETAATDGVMRLSDTQTRQLYRMANELINNSIKHANATEGQVLFRQTPTEWQLIVSDNGRGFDTSRVRTQEGIGLKNLQARARTIGATLTLVSGESGTVVSVTS